MHKILLGLRTTCRSREVPWRGMGVWGSGGGGGGGGAVGGGGGGGENANTI